MTEHTIYQNDRPTVTARPACAGTPQAQWIVRFVRYSPNGRRKMLDQCATWNPRLPGPQRWDRWRWDPIGSHLITSAQLGIVEAWLEGRPVEGEA